MRTICLTLLCLLLGSSAVVLGVGLSPGTTIQLTAEASYTDDLDQTHNANPASLTLTVLQVGGVNITTSPPAGRTIAGQSVYVPMKIINTGNGIDSFSLSISSANRWPVAIIYDNTASGVYQTSDQTNITNIGTGNMVPGGYCPCFAEVQVPSGATEGDTLTVTAVSLFNPVSGIMAAAMNVPAPNVTATGLTVVPNPSSCVANQTVALTGQITPAMVQSICMSITDPSDNTTTSNVTTDSTGSYQTSFQPLSVGDYSVTASFAGASGYESSSATAAVTVSSRAATALVLTATPSAATANQSVSISGIFSPEGQVPLTITCIDSAGNTTTTQVTTGVDGTFSCSTELSTLGNWQINASYAGSATQQPCTDSVGVQVSAPTPSLAPDAITVVGGPSLSPAAVPSAGQTTCRVTATDSQGSSVIYLWSDAGAGGSFSPNPAAQNPTYTAPANTGSADMSVLLVCTASSSTNSNVSTTSRATLTVHASQLAAPTVISVQPADSAGCIDLAANIVIQFDTAMDGNLPVGRDGSAWFGHASFHMEH